MISKGDDYKNFGFLNEIFWGKLFVFQIGAC